MKVVFLGTGTSTGVPQIGCKCDACKSNNPKDKRLRASLLISHESTQILIDCGPDFRQQFLRNNLYSLDAVLLTHEHYDHIGGIDDVRPLGDIEIYGEQRVLNVIERNMPYCFGENKYPGVPLITLNKISKEEFCIDKIAIQPIRVMHAKLPILGYRIGKMAYLTDVKTISDDAINQLNDLDILIINALRHHKHISHISLDEALEISQRIGAKKTFFTHMSHDMGAHDEVCKQLPENVQLAYDGLSLEIEP